ncbi:WhiB family transcriptional regulator [Streptomyces sp. yr375]|uniref:WhiB family transcriptional regulator n=1 Tax=Streptomyces sp. yr375 TaxID=1761906 RepID=UPI000B8495D5|nr:WhiB family transcriptional regulator [Streptomyces sp. yr375]
MASHTVLHARPTRGPVRGPGAHIPEAALPCQRRPDVFQHPLLETSTDTSDIPDASPEQRHQHLVLLRTARDLCASCPLWAECLQDAVAHAEPYGYAAATTPEDRRWIRRALAVGDPNGNLPTHATEVPGTGDTSRRLLRLRSRTTDAAARHAAERGLPELERTLDAFDARQEQLATLRRELHEHTTPQPTHRNSHPHPHAHPESRSEDMAAAESGQRIAFSYDDPAQAVRQALLAPLIRSALPTLDSLEQLATMLASVPGGDIAPELPDNLRTARKAVEALTPNADQAPHAPTEATTASTAVTAATPTPTNPLRTLTGSVSIELATTDPVTALRRDFLEPLLHELASSLANIEKVTTMLAATSDADEVHLEPIRTALQGIRARLPHPTTPHGPAGTGTSTGTGMGIGTGTPLPPPPATPSIRSAVETVAATFPGPFSARDVLRALPPGVYGDPSKTISNVLSALVKSGRLQRLARGTYARTVNVPQQDEAQSA